MQSVILQAEELNLPKIFAFKMSGKKVEITENGDSIVIKPVESSIKNKKDAWESFKKYKGIITDNIDEKIELANARDEKYASFN